jgi:outer membrane protein OmpA-like peptidoglycan-associated protein
MRFSCAALLIIAAVGACTRTSEAQKFSVFFQPYSAALDDQALDTVHAAADFASANVSFPVAVAGFAAPPDPKLDVEGLSAQRAAAVKQMLVNDGVKPDRIVVAANGTTDPKTLPNLAVRRVDITVGR